MLLELQKLLPTGGNNIQYNTLSFILQNNFKNQYKNKQKNTKCISKQLQYKQTVERAIWQGFFCWSEWKIVRHTTTSEVFASMSKYQIECIRKQKRSARIKKVDRSAQKPRGQHLSRKARHYYQYCKILPF